MKKIDPVEEGYYAIETLAVDTFVRIKSNGKKVYLVKGYDREARMYYLEEYTDCSGYKYLKKGTKVYAGFIY